MIQDKVINILENKLGEEDIELDDNIKNDLGADEFDRVEILMEVEDEFDFDFDYEDDDKFNEGITVQEFINMIKSYI